MVAADFNKDGLTDLAVAEGQAGGPGEVSILLGKPDGTFAPNVDYPIGHFGAADLVAGDFNGDGNMDIAVISASQPTLYILLGNGDGTFQAATVIPLSSSIYNSSVAAGDFNGDHKLDLAITDAGSGQVAILLGNGDGTFQTPVTYQTGSSPSSVAAGDFNGDGKVDLAVANGSSNSVSILLGNGDGTFQASQDYAAGTNPH